MICKVTPEFWNRFNALPADTRKIARRIYEQWLANPWHPSIHFKLIGKNLWSARIGLHHRAVGKFMEDGVFLWIWIGDHADYNRMK